MRRTLRASQRRPAARSIWALALTLALVAVACRGSGGRQGFGPGSRPRPGGTLRVAILEPRSIVPSRASDTDKAGERPSLTVLSAICDPLVSADPASGALRPGAADAWTVAPDARKVTLTLRQGVTFHNGRAVAAADYVFSLSRFVHPDTGSDQHFFLEKVVGYRDVRERRARELTGVKALDDKTLEIELAEPFAEILTVLSHPAAGSAIPTEEVDAGAEGFARRPVCTGPYALAAPWQPGGEIRLQRRNGYQPGATAHSRGGAGYADEIVFSIVPDLEAGYRQLEEARVDVAEVPVNRLVPARQAERPVESRPNGLLSYLGLPVGKGPFDKAELRRALSLALDRRAIVDELLAGSRRVATGLLPPTAGPAAGGTACEAGARSRADAEAAKSALSTSGIDPAATKLAIYFNDGGSGHQAWLQKVAEQWKSTLGLEAELRPDEFKHYLDFLAEGKADGPFRLAWPVDYPSPEGLLGPLLAGGSLDNYSGYASQAFDEALGRARAAAEPGPRQRAYREAAQIACRDLPIVPVWFGMNHVGFSSSVRGALRTRLGLRGEPLLRELGTRS